MADFKVVDGVTVPVTAEEQTDIDAKRAAQVLLDARTDDEIAEQDFPLDLNNVLPVVRAAIEVLAIDAGFTPTTLREAVKVRLIARNFYR